MMEPPWRSNDQKEKQKLHVDETSQEDQVSDRYGLGRFVKLLCKKDFVGKNKLTFGKLFNRAKELKCEKEWNRSRLVRLHSGEARVKVRELESLASIYGVHPLLFYNFHFPAFGYAIAVNTKKDKESDMREIPACLYDSKHSSCYVPCRQLAYSDIAIVILTLEGNNDNNSQEDFLENRHPGYELITPLEGKIVVELSGTKRDPISQNEYAYFRSHIRHRVFNAGKSPARVLVIRFLEGKSTE